MADETRIQNNSAMNEDDTQIIGGPNIQDEKDSTQILNNHPAPEPEPKKSKMWILWASLGTLLVGGGIAAFFLTGSWFGNDERESVPYESYNSDYNAFGKMVKEIPLGGASERFEVDLPDSENYYYNDFIQDSGENWNDNYWAPDSVATLDYYDYYN